MEFVERDKTHSVILNSLELMSTFDQYIEY